MIGVKVIATSCGLPGSAPLDGKDNQKRWETIRHNRALKTVKSGARIRTSESSLGSSDNRLVPILSKKVEKKDMPSLAKLVDYGWTWVVRRTCGRISLADSRWRSPTPTGGNVGSGPTLSARQSPNGLRASALFEVLFHEPNCKIWFYYKQILLRMLRDVANKIKIKCYLSYLLLLIALPGKV